MEVLDYIQELEDMIEDGSRSFFGGKVSVEKEHALALLRDVRIGLPDSLKQADWITQEKQRIIDEATSEAKKIISEARQEVESLVADHEITKKAEEKSKAIIAKAVADGTSLRNGAIAYVQEILENLEKDVSEVVTKVKDNYQELESLKVKTK